MLSAMRPWICADGLRPAHKTAGCGRRQPSAQPPCRWLFPQFRRHHAAQYAAAGARRFRPTHSPRKQPTVCWTACS